MFVASTPMPRERRYWTYGPVDRPLLRLRAAVDEHRERRRAVALRPVQPGRDLPAVEARVADELGLAQVAARRQPAARISVTGSASPVAVSTTNTSAGPRRLVPDEREPRAVAGERQSRSRASAAVPGGSFGAGSSAPRTRSRTWSRPQPSTFSIHASTRPSAEPASSSMSRVRRLDPLARARGERVERERRELAPLVRQEVEAGAVRHPRAGQELRLALVRRRLDRVAGRDVEDQDRDVGVRAERRSGAASTRRARSSPANVVHPLAEEVARLGLALAPDVQPRRRSACAGCPRTRSSCRRAPTAPPRARAAPARGR